MEFTFKFTEQEANLVLQGLGELPAKTSMSIINKIQIQAKEQMDSTKTVESEILTEDGPPESEL